MGEGEIAGHVQRADRAARRDGAARGDLEIADGAGARQRGAIEHRGQRGGRDRAIDHQQAVLDHRLAGIGVGAEQPQRAFAELGQAALARDHPADRHRIAGLRDLDRAAAGFQHHRAVEHRHRGAGDAQRAIVEMQARRRGAERGVLVDDDGAAIGHQRLADEGVIVDAVFDDGLLQARIGALAVEQCLLLFLRQAGEDRHAVRIRDLTQIHVRAHIVAREIELLVLLLEDRGVGAPDQASSSWRHRRKVLQNRADPVHFVRNEPVVGERGGAVIGIGRIVQYAEIGVVGIIDHFPPFAEGARRQGNGRWRNDPSSSPYSLLAQWPGRAAIALGMRRANLSRVESEFSTMTAASRMFIVCGVFEATG